MKTTLGVLSAGFLLLALGFCRMTGPSFTDRVRPPERRLRDVLVFLRPAWYRHASLDSLGHWFQHFGWENGFNVDTTDHPEMFNPDDLARYDVVVFISTTDLGNALSEVQKASLVDWYRHGHGIVALHAAAV